MALDALGSLGLWGYKALPLIGIGIGNCHTMCRNVLVGLVETASRDVQPNPVMS